MKDARLLVIADRQSHCPYCAFQCGMTLSVAADGSAQAQADPSFPVNNGQMCIKGFTSAQLLHRSDRLHYPVKRTAGGGFREISWEAALDEIAERIRLIQRENGPDAVACFGSGALTNEKAYLLGKFARVALRTRMIDYNGRYCMSSAAAGQNRSFGIDRGLPFPVADIAGAQTVMLWGTNLADTLPPIMQYFEKMRENGGRMIVVDPRLTSTARQAQLHLQLTPGSDVILANGLLHLAIEMKRIDTDYIRSRTMGFDSVRSVVSRYTPDLVERVCGIGIQKLRQTVIWLSEERAMLLSGRGPEQQVKGVDGVCAMINLMLALGQVGKPFSGYGTLTGQGNGQGGREHGQKSDQLPGYRFIENPTDRMEIAKFWGISANELPRKGLSAVEMLRSLGQQIKGFLVFGSNVVVATPDSEQVESGLRALDLLVVADSFLNETSRHADFVLPVTQWAEEEGTMTNLEGRVIHRRPMIEPPSGVRTDWWILCELAKRLGWSEQFDFSDVKDIFHELAEATRGGRADYSGINYDKIDRNNGVFWPCSSVDHPGTPRLFEQRFFHPDGLARFVPVEHRPSGEMPDQLYPLYLTTGRYKEQYNSGAQTRKVVPLRSAQPAPRVQVHPRLAERLGLEDGKPAIVHTRRASGEFIVQITTDIRSDTIFIPFHYGGKEAVNRLTNPVLDPISRMPEYKICAARIEPTPTEEHTNHEDSDYGQA